MTLISSNQLEIEFDVAQVVFVVEINMFFGYNGLSLTFSSVSTSFN